MCCVTVKLPSFCISSWLLALALAGCHLACSTIPDDSDPSGFRKITRMHSMKEKKKPTKRAKKNIKEHFLSFLPLITTVHAGITHLMMCVSFLKIENHRKLAGYMSEYIACVYSFFSLDWLKCTTKYCENTPVGIGSSALLQRDVTTAKRVSTQFYCGTETLL